MVQILAQNIGQDMALVGGGVAVTLAGLLIKRGFQLCVGDGRMDEVLSILAGKKK